MFGKGTLAAIIIIIVAVTVAQVWVVPWVAAQTAPAA